jgi:hypothetical protein
MSQLSSHVRQVALLCAAAIPLALLSGCALTSTAAPDNSLDSTAGISGLVHGGRQPIVNATVKLWAAGNSGYGSATSPLATATTDSNGSFSFHPSGGGASYSCPSGGSSTQSQYLYITASGGQPSTGITNNTAALMLALGNCSTVLAANPSVVVNEVTTIASMFALQQFFSPSGSGLGYIGTSPTNITGLANAFATVNNLVNISSGTAYATTTTTGPVSGYATAPVVTITPEQTKINTLANILAACVNTNGSGAPCSTLFAGVNSTAALDTLQAAYYLATNPTSTVSSTSNLTAIYNTGVANSPFQPSLAPAPTDWTIGVTYGSTSASTAGNFFLLAPELLAVDSGGNVWIANYASASSATSASLTELSPTGTPMTNAFASGNIVNPDYMVIDPSNNVYVSDYGASGALTNTVLEYTAGGQSVSITTGAGPGPMVSDHAGNIFVAETNAAGGGATLVEIPAGSTSSSPTTPVTIGALASTRYSGIVMDQYYNVWVGGGSTTNTKITPFTYSSSTTPNWTLGTAAAPSCVYASEGAAIDSTGNIWLPNYSTSAVTSVATRDSLCEAFSSSSGTVSGLTTSYSGGGLFGGGHNIVDGGGNIWVSNQATGTTTPYGVSEFTNSGLAISPNNQIGSPTATGFYGFTHTYAEPFMISIDPSGNVWVGNYNSTATASNPGYITEIVGAAVPTITPIAAGLPSTPGGTMKIGTRP